MKKIIFSLEVIVLYSLTAFAQQSWFWQNPLPQWNDLNDVWVLNQNIIFAVGDKGTLLKSTNAGESWQITHKLNGISEDIVDVQFINEQKGWLLARTNYDSYWLGISTKVLVTIDGGESWNVIASFDSLGLNDFYFTNETTGWAVGSSGNALADTITGMIFKTSDGGYNWHCLYEQHTTGGLQAFSSIQFLDQHTGWIVGKEGGLVSRGGELLKTTDAGINWNVVTDSLGSVKSFQFLNDSCGWYIELISQWGSGYAIKKTTDGGVNWQLVFLKASPYFHVPSPSLYFVNESLGWISEGSCFLGSYWQIGEIHRTTNGGVSWLTESIECPGNSAMYFSDSITGSIVGMCGEILSTNDGGLTWMPQSTIAFRDGLTATDFSNQSTFWVAAQRSDHNGEEGFLDGMIYKTSDGGSSWICQLYTPGAPMCNATFTDIHAVSDQIVYAHGHATYKTTDGGASWINLDAGPVYGPIYFVDENTGFRGGQTGVFLYTGEIQKTTNGGVNWNTVLSASHWVRSIFFVDNSDGWAVGEGDIVYRTTNLGSTWDSTIITINNLTLNSVFFSDRFNGWATGRGESGTTTGALIIKSTDSGLNWTIVYFSQIYDFRSIYFTNLQNGFVVSSTGEILATTNSGTTWYFQFEGSAKSFNDIVFASENIGLVVGNGGVILKTTTGGISFVEEKEIDEAPTEFLLLQNYPNPFNPSTTISWQSPVGSWQTLKVYDVLGNEVATLVDEYKPSGRYEVEFQSSADSHQLASGIYFYKLKATPSGGQAGSFIETKKMLLLK